MRLSKEKLSLYVIQRKKAVSVLRKNSSGIQKKSQEQYATPGGIKHC